MEFRHAIVPVPSIPKIARQASGDVDTREQCVPRVHAGTARIEIDEGSSAAVRLAPAATN